MSLGMSSSTALSYRTRKERRVTRAPGMVLVRNVSGRGYAFSAHTAVITGAIYF